MSLKKDSRLAKIVLGYGLVLITVLFLVICIHIFKLFPRLTQGQYIPLRRYARIILDSFILTSIIIIFTYIKNNLRLNKELDETKTRYESVVNNVKEVIFQTNEAGLWTFLNPSWTEVTGFTVEESIGINFLSYVYEEDRDRNALLFRPLMERQKEYCRHEVRYIKKDGSVIWVEVYARLTTDKKGNIIGTSGTITDINDRKNMEIELTNKDKILYGIAEATNILLYDSDYSKAFSMALEKLGKVTDVDRVYIFENHTNSETGKVLTSQRFEWTRENINSQINNAELQNLSYEELGINRWYDTLLTGGVAKGLVKNCSQSEKDILCPQGIVSIVAVPIMIDEQFWGFIGFDDCQKERMWSGIEISTLIVAAAGIGAAIRRKNYEAQLQLAKENDFRRTVKNLQNLVFKFKRRENGEFYYTLFEGKIAERQGKDSDNMYGKTLWEVLSLENAKLLEFHLIKAFNGEPTSYEFKINGHIQYETLSPVIENGRVIEVIGSCIDMTDIKKAQEQIKHLAYHDNLTNLPNRILFKDRLDLAISHSLRNKEMLSVMFMDLDRFKNINDTLGHEAGDWLIKEVALRLSGIIEKDDTISRMGGDEFTIIFNDVKDEENITNLADKVRGAFKEPFNINGNELFITTSIGISVYPNDGENSDTLIKNADIAMYRAKELGKNNFQFFTSSMNEKAVRRLELEKSLRKALEKNEFLLHYQPQINLSTGKIIGCEALIRWDKEGKGLVSPGEFIPLAEETGLIIPIGEWVLESACKQLAKWNSSGYKNLRIAVNISANQFENQDLSYIIKRIINKTGINPEQLELELTESMVMKSTERAATLMRKLKAIGVKISIDDFGTGFSSLGYLQKFSADILKIDQSFVRNIPYNGNDEAIVTAIINMAHSLKLQVIAEGVETKEQLAFLKSKNCDAIQGYYISKPVPCLEFEKLLL